MVRTLIGFLYSYKYETDGIDGALQNAFGKRAENVLYNLKIDAQDPVKLGAVATSSDAAPKMCLLSNYLRDWDLQQVKSKTLFAMWIVYRKLKLSA